MNEVLVQGNITYDERGIKDVFRQVSSKFSDESFDQVKNVYIPEF